MKYNMSLSGIKVKTNSADDVIKLWTQDSDTFDKMINEQFNDERKEIWRELLLKNIDVDNKAVKILDAGTGTGFFAIILSLEGYEVTGIDFTEAMLEKARRNAKNYGVNPLFVNCDMANTVFNDETFDVIVSRNVVWTMPEPDKVFREWNRVLKPHGKIIIFDGNWNIRLFDEQKQKQYESDVLEAMKKFPEQGEIKEFPANELEFRLGLPLCKEYRPQWDFNEFLKLGFKKIICNPDISEQVMDPRSVIQFRSTPMFMITAVK